MPFTPFHFGPGLALAGATRRIDFWAFAAANVLVDLESGWNLWQLRYPVHGFFHSALGASLSILPAAALAVAASVVAVRAGLLRERIRVASAAAGAALGAWSHVLLDSIMHADARPAAPWSDENPLLGAVSLDALHNLCLAAGVLGALLIAVRARRRS